MAHVRRLGEGVTTILVLLILEVGGTAIPAHAQVDVLQASLFGAQEVPPTASSAQGIAVIFLDSTTNTINFTIAHNVTGATAAHFHANAFPGTNAPILINIGAITGLTSPMVGQATLTAQQATDILAGRWYINIHSGAFPGGEIRGQVAATAARPLVISPRQGPIARTAGFDLTFILKATGVSIVGGSLSLNGVDVTVPFAACIRVGTLVSGGLTLRCPLPGGILAPGGNFLSIVLNLSNGSSVGNTVLYNVQNNTEP